jgi:hypothetical protein
MKIENDVSLLSSHLKFCTLSKISLSMLMIIAGDVLGRFATK